MAVWTEADLKAQLSHATAQGWIAHFQGAASKYQFPLELLLAIASRETNIRNIKGDFRDGIYHGYGVMQVDIGTAPEFCKAWTETDIEGSVDNGTKILNGKRQFLAGKQITALQAIAAAYNTGEGNVLRSVTAHQDPDHTTTGGDYGKDVLARMAVFARELTGAASTAS